MSQKSQKHLAYLFAILAATLLVAPFNFLYAVNQDTYSAEEGDRGSLVAQTYVPLAPLPDPPAGIPTEGLSGYLQTLFWLAIVGAGVLAVLMITIGGLRYMASEAFGEKSAAKNQITMAIVGFILAISSVLILQTINPDLLKFKLTLDSLGFPPPTTGTVATPVPGCNMSAAFDFRYVTSCLWIPPEDGRMPTCFSNLNYIPAAGVCSEESPGNNYACCANITPQNGCNWRGLRTGYKQCRWSLDNSVGNSCTVALGMPAGFGDIGDQYCSDETKPENWDWASDCCGSLVAP